MVILPRPTGGLAVPQIHSRQSSNSCLQSQSRPHHFDLPEAVEHALRDILDACQEACEARRCALEGSPEWHKRTGEILAYGNMTHIFSSLQQRLLTKDARRH